MTTFEWPADPEDNRQYCRLEQLNSGWWQLAVELCHRQGEIFPGITVTVKGIELSA